MVPGTLREKMIEYILRSTCIYDDTVPHEIYGREAEEKIISSTI